MTPRLCPCGKPLRSDNKTALCHLCQAAHRAGRTCACGCGAPVGTRSTSGYTAACRLRALAQGLLSPAR